MNPNPRALPQEGTQGFASLTVAAFGYPHDSNMRSAAEYSMGREFWLLGPSEGDTWAMCRDQDPAKVTTTQAL